MLGWLRRLKPDRRLTREHIEADESAVHVWIDGRVTVSFRWDRVQSIQAWKEDLLTSDLICLGFAVCDREEPHRLHEEMEGWKALVEQLARRFPDVDPEWWSRVAFPAFAANHMVIWERQQAPNA